ncbi:phage terminase large subunit-like protein [Litoreibacter halocynthiae]|uniref:Phage terminase large subunit-like protein n=1 Tax=Litoreibacter halocynthiae TaxID=1242689 RepID=A0A4R7LR99_9RHOB|nr:phage terminase large subunit-like protein [Litoreibacter halocynthiae]
MNTAESVPDERESLPSTLGQPGLRSGAALIASKPDEIREAFLEGLSDEEASALPFLFDFWAHPHQLPPAGDWRSWVIMGGRGAGKTRAGAEWVRMMVEGDMPGDPGRARRVALVGETFDQVRDVMIFGDSGILACSPPDRRPEWQATRRRLVWPNGAIAEAHSASSPEHLRGPQFDAAWVDELAKWTKAREAYDQLQFALRLGDRPQQVFTTTPRNVTVLKQILDAGSTVVTHAPTEANKDNLAASFLEEVRRRYGNTRMGRQELDGILLDDLDGALWTASMLEDLRVTELPDFERVVVAVDPAVSSKKASDACGIVVAGLVRSGKDWEAVVIEDATVEGASPTGWAHAVLAAYERHGAERIVAEVNQGGDLVETLIHQLDPVVPYRSVHASRGKAARAEPVAALYEQGRVKHYGALGPLEDQMCQMTVTGFQGSGSPDRVDALVWALTELMGAAAPQARIRTL